MSLLRYLEAPSCHVLPFSPIHPGAFDMKTFTAIQNSAAAIPTLLPMCGHDGWELRTVRLGPRPGTSTSTSQEGSLLRIVLAKHCTFVECFPKFRIFLSFPFFPSFSFPFLPDS